MSKQQQEWRGTQENQQQEWRETQQEWRGTQEKQQQEWRETQQEWRETQEKRLEIDQQKADFNSALFRITALAVLAVCIAARILLQRSRALDRGRCS